MKRAQESVSKLESTVMAAINEPTISLEAFPSKPFQSLSGSSRAIMAHFEVLMHSTSTVLTHLCYSMDAVGLLEPFHPALQGVGKSRPHAIYVLALPCSVTCRSWTWRSGLGAVAQVSAAEWLAGGVSGMLDGSRTCRPVTMMRSFDMSQVRRQCTAIKYTQNVHWSTNGSAFVCRCSVRRKCATSQQADRQAAAITLPMLPLPLMNP